MPIHKETNRLAIGTVQFGGRYGVANNSGQVCFEEVKLLIESAKQNGIDTLDTAISYGESENVLGGIGVSDWRVVSKLPSLPDCCNIHDWVEKSVNDSLNRLKVHKLHALLLHRPVELLGKNGKELYRALCLLKKKGMTDKIGISIYDITELDAIFSSFKIDLVQAPFNILDRSLVTSGWLSTLKKNKVEVHARSIFLQGLLLMERTARPKYFNRWQFLWDKWHKWLNDEKIMPLQVCLNFALSYPEIDRLVVGVDKLIQLNEIINSVSKLDNITPKDIVSTDIELINPSKWRI